VEDGGVAPVFEWIKSQWIQYLCLKTYCLWTCNAI